MLNLTRREGETLVFDNDTRITINEIRGNQVRIAIKAPDDIGVLREEVCFAKQDTELSEIN